MTRPGWLKQSLHYELTLLPFAVTRAPPEQ